MNVVALLHALGSVGLFSSRVFLPALLTSLLLRFGPDVPMLHHLGLLSNLPHNQPTWFTHNITLGVLAALSVIEILAQKNPEARHLLHEFDAYLKAALAALTSLGVINATDGRFAQQLVHQAGIFSDAILPLIAALGTWRVSRARRDVAIAVFDHVQGTHLDHLLSWLEEAWVVFGAFLLVLFPLLMVLVIGIATAVLYGVRKRLDVLEDRRKAPCPNCGTPHYPSAIACPSCRQPLERPAAVGFLGQSKPFPTDDPANHPYRLIEKRRCRSCATRLAARRPFEPCAACGSSFAEPRFVEAYAGYVARRLPVVLGICFLMSLVPVLGMIVGAVFYRMELVLPFSQYLPMGRRFLLRWFIRLMFFVLILFQVIPVLGAFVVPLMAFISFAAYRDSFLKLMLAPREHPAPVAHPAPPAIPSTR